MANKHSFIFFITFLISLFAEFESFAQCPQLFDQNAIASSSPQWVFCNGKDAKVTIQPPVSTPIGAYTIDFGDGNTSSGAKLVSPGISHIYTATVDTLSLTLTETATGCVIKGLVVLERPVYAAIKMPFSASGCTPTVIGFINNSNSVSKTTTFRWNFGDGSPVVTYDHTNLGDTVFHTYAKSTVSCNTTATLIAENYCSQGTPSTNTFNPILVWDIDEANITPSTTSLCYPDTTFTFQNTTKKNCAATLGQGNLAQRYEYWNFGDYWGKGTDSIIDWRDFDPPVRGANTLSFPGVGSYTISMKDSNQCGVSTASVTVNVTTPPVAGVSLVKDSVCAGNAATFNNLSSGSASFYWDFGDGGGFANTGSGSQSHTYTSAGDYMVKVIARGGSSCADTASVNIHILKNPQASFVTDKSIGCDSLTVAFTDASVDATAWAWTFDNGNSSSSQTPSDQFYNGSKNYSPSLKVTAVNGCTNTFQKTINIFQTPVANFSAANVCVLDVASFTDISVSSSGDPVTSWNWDFGDATISSQKSPTHVYTITGPFDVTLNVATANCVSFDTTRTITVEEKPTSDFSLDTSSGCSPLIVSFTNTSSANSSKYYWDFGDGTSDTTKNTSHKYVNNTIRDTSFTVLLITETVFGCKDTLQKTISVFATPLAGFTSDAAIACAPVIVTFTNTTQGDISKGANSYRWNFGDSSTSSLTNPSNVYENTTLFMQNYFVTLIAQSFTGCSDTTKQSLFVFPKPDLPSSIVADTGCSPFPVTFPAIIGASVYDWNYGDGKTDSLLTPTHIYTNSSTNDASYNVKLIVTNSFQCKDTTVGKVVVHPKPSVSIKTNKIADCQPLDITFTKTTSSPATKLHWDFGDGTTIDTTATSNTYKHRYTHTSSDTVNYDISLIAESNYGCTDTAYSQVTAYPEVIAAFTVSDTTGCSPLTINFANLSQHADSYEWDFGDGFKDIDTNVTHTFTNSSVNDSTYTVRLISVSKFTCSDTAYIKTLVHPTPDASFMAIPVTQTYPETTVTITNTTSQGNWQYLWDFGDSTTSSSKTPGTHQYSIWNKYLITLYVSSLYCSDTATQDIEILPPIPIADFIGSAEGCKPLTVQFTNKSQYANTYSWSFGDGGSSYQENPSYTYYNPGVYSVILKVIGDGGKDDTVHVDSVTVHDLPSAYFVPNPDTVYIPNSPVLFYNLSNNADTYQWDFGDGESSVEMSPQHYYDSAAIYTITLIATNQFGCINSVTLEDAVTAMMRGRITPPNAFTPNPNGSNGGVFTIESLDNDVFHPVLEGVIEYHLSIFNRWGERIFESFDQNIGWDGYYHNVLCKQDIYIWRIEVSYINGEKAEETGDVLLLRR